MQRGVQEKAGVYPLSPMQQGMLYHHLSASESDADMVQVIGELREELDVERFERAWRAVAARHQAFRTRFHWEGLETPTQEVLPEATLQPQLLDWRDRPGHERPLTLDKFLESDRRLGFDLTTAPAMRLTLARWSDAEWRVIWSWPHILLDGRSIPLILGEVFDLYDGRATLEELAPPPQYSEFLEWLPRRDRSGDERYWRTLLEGLTGPTPLPGDAVSASDRGTGRGAKVARLTRDETAAIAELATSVGVTENAVIQGAWAVLLSRYAGTDDVVFGAARASRHGTIPNADHAAGLFITTVPVRARYNPDASVGEWLRELRQGQIEVRPYEYTAISDIQRWSGFAVGQPVFDSAVIFERTSLGDTMRNERPEWTNRRFWLTEPTPVPLTIYGFGGEQLDVKLLYDRDRLADNVADRVLSHLVTLLREIPRDPERPLREVSMLSAAERRRQLVEWNETDAGLQPGRTVHGLVESQVERTPDREAVTDGATTLCYRDLDARSNRLAHRLLALGVMADGRVGVCADRSADLIVAVLGVLKAGGAYVPLDPDYPAERLEYMARDAGLVALVTADDAAARIRHGGVPTVDLTRDADALMRESAERPTVEVRDDQLAYVIYTSGSTGRPKGVMVEHRNVVSFFAAMDARIPYRDDGAWLAVTSLAFDISVLELVWPLTRGLKVVVGSPVSSAVMHRRAATGPQFSLFYFASAADGAQDDKYRLLIEGARFADEHGFHAVWTPERHFHAFGGLYPNPAVTSAALATITQRVRIRAGSVVLPLHHPIRVAEEWALVDNLSNGRVDISFAAGWQPNDFALAPERYADRKRVMLEGIEVVRRLWRGEAVSFPGPNGTPVEVRTLPRPIQAELPVWVTTAGSAETYRAAGEAGANILTHLLGQSVEDLAAMIQVYREARRSAGHQGPGQVTLMLHAFVGDDHDAVRETVRGPMKSYLKSSVSLIKGFAGAWIARRGTSPTATGDEFDTLSPEDMESLLDFAFERYFETSGLFGSPARCVELAQRLREAGVDEIACLIDFGVPADEVLAHLEDLDAVRRTVTRSTQAAALPALSTLMRDHDVTHMQCTPSLARMLLADEETRTGLRQLDVLLIGGEPFPGALATELRRHTDGLVLNMYGPTETTIWSSTHEVEGDDRGTVPIGRPIRNTKLYVLDRHGEPVAVGVPGELYIGGAGVVRGYLGRPDLTTERFVEDHFSGQGRLYRTGDVVRWRDDGVIEFLGRADNQVKIRGHRIELGEIEAVLSTHPDVGDVVVNPWQRGDGDPVLVAYVVPADSRRPAEADLRAHAEAQLPGAMVPSYVVTLDRLPLTPNGKIDRKALPPVGAVASAARHDDVSDAPATAIEELVADIWRTVLGVERIGPRDRFFTLGGNSLTTIQVAMRIRELLGIDVPLRVIFETPTVADLAAYLESRLLQNADTEVLESLLAELEHQPAEAHRGAPA
ncbi:MAG TPA: MupA/Atu3671 family FMN-dependent luciferase-like monooxygenase [Gemmatimonadaceae bacterium]|nr:MupA/Atu3671 family FMN-dependent luciferase-like monooxygenase [Gemmatimonadaceae bacterium]